MILGSLTVRERDVLALMAEGRSNGAIAGTLVISERAVEKHIANIFSKLGLAPSDGPPPCTSRPPLPRVLIPTPTWP